MERIAAYEHILALEYYNGLGAIPVVQRVGPDMHRRHRAPTVSFYLPGLMAEQVCQKLNEKGICAWDGHFYAIRPLEVLGLLEQGGLTRVGISLYNTREEIERTLQAIKELTGV